MTLHIFNPDHELAMASDLDNYTPPRNVARFAADFDFLPALWATPGDAVLVGDIDRAKHSLKRITNRMRGYGWRNLNDILFVTYDMLESIVVSNVSPWGWNTSLRNRLIRRGINIEVMPSLEVLSDIRLLSHRSTAALLLSRLQSPAFTGKMSECRTMRDTKKVISRLRQAVVKSPWSCSGRGVRFVSSETVGDANLQGWMKNMLASQGSLMVEPYYKKVKDFGMEFLCHRDGTVEYQGLSLFKTLNGAYTGNILATERTKEEMINRYVSAETLELLKKTIATETATLFKDKYHGPFGIDMMIVPRDDKNGFLVHPCVEINLRRTMGHVALGISPTDDEISRVMRVSIGENYVLKINNIQG